VTGARAANQLARKSVFVSASIPNPARWEGDFDALEITDAVVAVAREVLSRDGRLITAAHPTIAPLLLYVAAESPPTSEPLVVVYQSAVFDAILPEATLRFEAAGVGSVIRTTAVAGEPPDPAQAPRSLDLMRRQMLTDEAPVAAVFIGGMAGIPVEHDLFSELCPESPTYALGHPGGEARSLVDSSPLAVRELLTDGDVYPAVARAILDDIINQQG
jgi:hypothetical protein